ncbi:MAG: tRNA uridine-5-carboxymethylaminomethyl(34) synthesis GTPase MnmE [Oscillospiraceae bacterium]|nr:tRNA uridine-5-carboxymethylaminomethyl(34) synthesis GTPase MnmE [Oscillospiraceae bacterium]
MFGTFNTSNTIAAIATGTAISAIGIIRLSGSDAIEIVSSVFHPSSGRSLAEIPDRTLVLGVLNDAKGETLDHCLCTVSRAPNSYTGENTAELQCHGSPVVLRLTLEALFSRGARQAAAGEFTKRAFLNGRMDLTQAEAVIDLIDSETDEAAKNAAGQLGGAILRKTDRIYGELVDIISHYHAVLDYPDEDIDEFRIEAYLETLLRAGGELKSLLETFERGKVMKSGVKAAIVGKPNAGKSSLLNALLGFERAIVTSIPGTTRDTIEECVTLGGVKLRLIDTAGLRGTSDPIEKIGVDRAIGAAASSELVLAVFDGSEELSEEDEEAILAAKGAKRRIAIINKSDLPQKLDLSLISKSFDRILSVSALDKMGLGALDEEVSSMFPIPEAPAGEILTNSRHADAVARALASVEEAVAALKTGATPDIVLTETENALSALGELTGKTVREDVTRRIFERFCVGK